MLRPVRTAISVAVLAGLLWAAFAVELGDDHKTFADHIDTISETPEARQLVDDTRATINPALAEIRDRLLGEYVEAPTWIPEQERPPQVEPTLAASRPPEPRSAAADSGHEPALPGRRRAPR